MEEQSLAAINRELLIWGHFSDYTIHCGGNTFRVHRNIICPQSRYFNVAANGNFLVSKLPILLIMCLYSVCRVANFWNTVNRKPLRRPSIHLPMKLMTASSQRDLELQQQNKKLTEELMQGWDHAG